MFKFVDNMKEISCRESSGKCVLGFTVMQVSQRNSTATITNHPHLVRDKESQGQKFFLNICQLLVSLTYLPKDTLNQDEEVESSLFPSQE
jgi:hypothetical protein